MAATDPEAGPQARRSPLLIDSSEHEQSSDAEELTQIIEFLHKVPAFQDLPDEDLPALAKAFSLKLAKVGEVIFKQGDEGHEIFFIQAGKVSIRIQKNDINEEEEQLAELWQGQYFGETALLTDNPRNASAYAVGEVKLRVLSREQFQAFRSKLTLEAKHAELTNGLKGLCWRSATVKVFGKFLLVLAVYFGLSILIFTNLEQWNWFDCVYFSVITLMTVGYGDFAPTHPVSRLFVVVFILAALIVVATQVGQFLESVVALEIQNDKARKALLVQASTAVGVFDEKSKQKIWRRKFTACLAAIGVLLAVSTMMSYYLVEDCRTVVDALYFSVVTLTTIGYGDVEPKKVSSKIVVCIIALLGVPFFGTMLGQIVEIAYGNARSNDMHTIVGGLTDEKFDQMLDFTDQLWRAGTYTPGKQRREQITALEFLCFILHKNESVSIDEIKAIMTNFVELDTSGDGHIDPVDVLEWQRRGAKNHSGMSRQNSSRVRRSSVSSLAKTNQATSASSVAPTPL